MSADAKLSVPVRLLLEGVRHVVTVELKNGESYRGELCDAEESMSLQMSGVTHTARDGQKKRLEHVYVRGAMVRLIVFPDILREATIFRQVTKAKAKDDAKVAARGARGAARGGRGRGRGRGRGQGAPAVVQA
jgi:small nuclear ribonucleoprotein D3